MGSTSAERLPGVKAAKGSETKIEIKIKTLDSQTYTLRVDKQVPVPALKEQIASVTGVVSEQQRLICRGRVLKDDQLLSAYHVEDGHTLHMVVRQPVPPSSESAHNNSGRSNNNQGSPSVVIETFSLPDQGDGVPPEISQIISAVLGSIGLSSIASASHGIDAREAAPQRSERASVTAATLDSAPPLTDQDGTRAQSNRPMSAFGIPAPVSLGAVQPPVIADSLATLSQYLSQMRQEFDGSGSHIAYNVGFSFELLLIFVEFIVLAGRSGGSNGEAGRNSGTASWPGTGQEGLPTPASLGEVMHSTRQMLVEQAGDTLLQLAGQLENQANVTGSLERMSTQSNAWRTGVLLHNLGAFLLELGRTTMTLRLGQSPSEAIVNAGPAVFISPSGPNPLMVQPLPFQPGTSFNSIPTGSVQAGTGLVNSRGTGFLPRRIDIQIRRGGSSTATPNSNQEERGNVHQLSRQGMLGPASENLGNQPTSRNSEGMSFGGESGVRVVPIRTMVAAVPAPLGRLPSESSGNSVGLYYPLLGRFQHIASGVVSGERGHQASGEPVSAGVETEQPSVPGPGVQQRNTQNFARNGSLPTPNSRQQEQPSIRRGINVSVLTAGGTHNNQESDQNIPSGVLNMLRTLFPGGEIHVEDSNSHRPTSSSAPVQENAPTSVPGHVTSSGGSEAEASVSEEGVFLSNMLRQIMPFVSQHESAEQDAASTASEYTTARGSSAHAESSATGRFRRRGNSEPSGPNSKRHKTE